jgi:type 1 glutamine amidotransferase
MRIHLGWASLAVVLSFTGVAARQARADDKQETGKIRVVIIDGQNNHDWRATTPHLKKVLETAGRFSVDVSSNLKPGDKPGTVETVSFPPNLSKYDVVLSNYNGAGWPDDFNRSFEARLREGKIGLVIVHAANNAFGGWKEYDLMIGMGWRDKDYGDRLKLDDRNKTLRLNKGTDQDSGHRYVGPFPVTVRDPDHPITKGMPRQWMHAQDELYDNMRGPIQNVHLLATAYSDSAKNGTGAHEPMIWTVIYGQGRVFHTPMGHDLNGMRCVGFAATLARGTEWAATAEVTLPLPDNFPTADKTSSLPAK